MPTVTEQLLSRTIYATDGTTTDWEFSFSGGYLLQSHVKAYTQTPEGARANITLFPEDFTGLFTLRLTPALPAGLQLVIYRDTPKDLPLVDFTDESGFSEIALDTNAKQAVFIAAEAADAINTSISFDAAESATLAANAAAAAVAAQANADASVADAAAYAGEAINAATAAANSAIAAEGAASGVFNTNTTVFTRSLLTAADATAAKTTLGITPNLGTNVFINGCMRVAQRGSAALVTAGNAFGGADRWTVYNSSSAIGTVDRFVSADTASGFVQRVTVTTAQGSSASFLRFIQGIESFNSRQFSGKSVTISGKLFNTGAAGKVCQIKLVRPLGSADNYGSSAVAYTVNLPALASQAAAQPFSATIAIAATHADLGLQVWIEVPLGATETGAYSIGDMVIEGGSTATVPPLRQIGEELALCQRYLPSLMGAAVSHIVGPAYTANTTQAVGMFTFPVTPRVVPTGLTVSSPGHFQFVSSGSYIASALTLGGATSLHVGILVATIPTAPASAGGAIQVNNAAARLYFTGCEIL